MLTPLLIICTTKAILFFFRSVDPVVYVGDPEGYIYERQAIYHYLEQSGRDYASQAPATALNYKSSAVATRLSAEIATRYGATLVLVDNLFFTPSNVAEDPAGSSRSSNVVITV